MFAGISACDVVTYDNACERSASEPARLIARERNRIRAQSIGGLADDSHALRVQVLVRIGGCPIGRRSACGAYFSP
jgi:hypothetical protein